MSDGITKFRLILCVKDKPGSLYKILMTLKDDEHHGDMSNTSGDDGILPEEYYLNIKYITVETCERFARADSSIFDSPMNRLISLRPRARFHSIIELRKENKDTMNVVSVMEVTACLDRENTLESILQLLNLLQVKNDSLNAVIPKLEDKPVNRYIFIAYNNGNYSLHTLRSLLGGDQPNCPKMGTCPLVTSGIITCGENENIAIRDVTYIRDHGCYSREYTLLELIGELDSRGNKHNSVEKKKRNSINALVLTVHYYDQQNRQKSKEILDKYLSGVQQNWEHLGKDESEGMLHYLQNSENFIKLYLMKWTHTCEYYPCYIVRSIKPVFTIERS